MNKNFSTDELKTYINACDLDGAIQYCQLIFEHSNDAQICGYTGLLSLFSSVEQGDDGLVFVTSPNKEKAKYYLEQAAFTDVFTLGELAIIIAVMDYSTEQKILKLGRYEILLAAKPNAQAAEEWAALGEKKDISPASQGAIYNCLAFGFDSCIEAVPSFEPVVSSELVENLTYSVEARKDSSAMVRLAKLVQEKKAYPLQKLRQYFFLLLVIPMAFIIEAITAISDGIAYGTNYVPQHDVTVLVIATVSLIILSILLILDARRADKTDEEKVGVLLEKAVSAEAEDSTADYETHPEPPATFPVDRDKAEQYFRKAADTGIMEYINNYGLFLYHSGDSEKAKQVLQRGIDAGSALCMLSMGRVCENSDTELVWSRVWRKRKALVISYISVMIISFLLSIKFATGLLSLAGTIMLLGILAFAYGLLIKSNKTMEAWKKRAADTGDPAAVYAYYTSTKNKSSVTLLALKRSADDGCPAAMVWMAKKYAHGSRKFHLKKDPALALEYARKASEEMDGDGLAMLAYCYEKGIGVHANSTKAMQLYCEAFRFGSCMARRRTDRLAVLRRFDRLYGGLVAYENEQKIKSALHAAKASLSGDQERAKQRVRQLAAETATLRKTLDDTEESFASYCEKLGKSTVETATADVKNYSAAESELKDIYGSYWDKLQRESQISLISAHTLLKGTAVFESCGFDYSGVVITATSALENELQKYFFSDLKPLLREKHHDDYWDWPKAFVTRKDGVCKEKTYFTLGDLPHTLGLKSRISISDKQIICDYLRTIIKADALNGIDPLEFFCTCNIATEEGARSFLEIVEDIRLKYRNKAGHSSSIDRSTAEDCCSRVIGAIDKAEKQLKNVDGFMRTFMAMLN